VEALAVEALAVEALAVEALAVEALAAAALRRVKQAMLGKRAKAERQRWVAATTPSASSSSVAAPTQRLPPFASTIFAVRKPACPVAQDRAAVTTRLGS
jgi:hypothetical protein